VGFWEGFEKKARCWKGYKPVPGKKPLSKGSCEKIADDKTLYRPKPSTRPGKKYMVYVKGQSGNPRLIHFGATGYKHNYSEEAKKNFRARHNCEGASKDTPKWWACNYLWGTKQPVGTKTNKSITKSAGAKTKALVKYIGSTAKEEALHEPENVYRWLRREVHRKSLRDAAIGGIGGAVAGAALPQSGPDKITPEQKEKNKEFMNWWSSLSNYERSKEENRRIFNSGYVQTKGQKRLGAAIAGGLGLGTGTLLASGVARNARATRAQLKYENSLKGAFWHTPSGMVTSLDPNETAKNIITKFKDVIHKRPPITVRHGFSNDVEQVPAADAYNELMQRYKRRRPAFMTSGPFASPESRAADILQNEIAGKVFEQARTATKGNIPGIVSRLKAEGIKDYKQFARKYHPDVQSADTPKEISDNFSEIYKAFRGNTNDSDEIIEKIIRENQEKIRAANAAVKKFKPRGE